jgi:uncharacterized protein (TIGR03083 family)
MEMEPQQYLDHLTQSSQRLADAAGAAGPEADVPTCPGWTVEDLLVHCAGGDQWARGIVETGSREGVDRDLSADAPTGAALVDYFRAGARALHDALAATDPTASVWTFAPSDRTARFWYRRRAQETTVHRYDAETAAGSPTPVDPELAADGIDEILTVFVPRLTANFGEVGDATVHIHCTDVDGEWLVACTGGEITVTREHAKGDVAARGTASDLVLYLWGRVPADTLEVFGDADLLDRFRQAITV